MKLHHLLEDEHTARLLLKQVQRLVELSDPYGGNGHPVYFESKGVGDVFSKCGRVITIERMSMLPKQVGKPAQERIRLGYISGKPGDEFIRKTINAYDSRIELFVEMSLISFSMDIFSKFDLTHHGDHWMLS